MPFAPVGGKRQDRTPAVCVAPSCHDDRGDGAHDAHVAGATAKVAREFLADACLVGVGQSQHDVARRDQHPGRAVAALQCMVFVEGRAQGLHDRVVVEAFDGPDACAVAGDGQRDARARRCTVDLQCAGAAHAVFAAEMRAGQAQFLAQQVGQMGAGVYGGRHLLAVHVHRDGLHATASEIACLARRSMTAWI